jgi:hypothetical protein
MRRFLLFIALLATALASVAVIPQARVCAMGAPTENYTLPDPGNDPANGEVKLPVLFTRQGPSAQPAGTAPSFTTSFIGSSASDKLAVVADGKWYLDVDINAPGWLYIYEYYPPPAAGRWLAYKWQLKQGGDWRLGPFSATEKEGQHVYRLWFYGNGQWAVADPAESLIYWTYYPALKIVSFDASALDVKKGDGVTLSWDVQGAVSIKIQGIGPVSGASGTKTVPMNETTEFILTATGPDGQTAQSVPLTVNVAATAQPAISSSPPSTKSEVPVQVSFLDQLLSPVPLISILSVIVIIVLGVLLYRVYVKRWASPGKVLLLEGSKPLESPAVETPAVKEHPMPVRAKLLLPNGLEIQLGEGILSLGRSELARALGLDDLLLVSHKHIILTCDDDACVIEDPGSANGTRLNGDEIRDKGKMALKDDDTIDVAGTIKLKYISAD